MATSNEFKIEDLVKGNHAYPTYLSNHLNLKPDTVDKNMTVVLATYNRSPFDPEGPQGNKNPLGWCMDSILDQKYSPVKKVVIVNDFSTDYTEKVSELYAIKFAEQGINLAYMKNKELLEAHESRNVGSKLADTRFVYFVDDDCILSPFSLIGATRTYDRLKMNNPEMAVLLLAVYQRATIPTSIKTLEKIGTFDEATGKIHSAFDAFPEEYLVDKDIFMDTESTLLNPLPVKNICEGNTLFELDTFKEYGGYASFPPRSYGGGTALAFNLWQNGKKIFFSADPRFHAVHYRYGSDSNIRKLIGPDWKYWNGFKRPDLSFMLDESKKSKLNTGCRVEKELWYYSKIRNFLMIINGYSLDVGKNWMKTTYDEFVGRDVFGGMRTKKMPNKDMRKHIWETAVQHAFDPPKDITRTELMSFLTKKR